MWPLTVLAAFGMWCVIAAIRPGVWLCVVPGCLPFLNFSPWTGWLVFDEFDILLLGALAGGYGRIAWSGGVIGVPKISRVLLVLYILWGGAGLVALSRGFQDAGGFVFDWYAGYADPLNSLRVFKSTGFALLLVPLLQQEARNSMRRANHRLACGMAAGLTVVVLAVLWERAAFPGLLDFSTNYRTVALFWEMHVGGAAMDFYLALAMPFAVWAVVSAKRPMLWAGAAILALLTAYAILTTFARGLYLAVVVALVLLALRRWVQQRGADTASVLDSWRSRDGLWRWKVSPIQLLVMALLAETVMVLGGGSFMMERLGSTDRDLSSRTKHWQNGLALLDGPVDWLVGKGLGRLPENYALRVPEGEFSGELRLHDVPASRTQDRYGFVTVHGPATVEKLGGQFALTQRVSLVDKGPYLVHLDVRVLQEAQVQVELCERHLLYDGRCQSVFKRVLPVNAGWQTMALPLEGAVFEGDACCAPRMKVFSLSVVNSGGAADFDNVGLTGAQGVQLLENGGFSKKLARWFPAAQSYFLPWHIDNLFLELLIERGALGLLSFLSLIGYALWHLMLGRARTPALSPYLLASLCAALCVGLTSSALDVPRVAFLLQWLALFSIHAGTETHRSTSQSIAAGVLPGNSDADGIVSMRKINS